MGAKDSKFQSDEHDRSNVCIYQNVGACAKIHVDWELVDLVTRFMMQEFRLLTK